MFTRPEVQCGKLKATVATCMASIGYRDDEAGIGAAYQYLF